MYQNASVAYPKACKELFDELKPAEPGNALAGLREVVSNAQNRMGAAPWSDAVEHDRVVMGSAPRGAINRMEVEDLHHCVVVAMWCS